jgi:hypothetical protein
MTLKTRHTPPDELSQESATVSRSAVASCVCPGPPAPRMWQYKVKGHQKRDYGNRTIDVIDTYACSKVKFVLICEFIFL